MAYTINNFNGTTLATVADGTLNSATSINFAGRNFAGYGEYLNENQLWLMQHFANVSAPTNSVAGQIWYDTEAQQVKVYNGTAYKTLANIDNLTAQIDTVNSAIIANVNTLNANIVSNVATLVSNAASQNSQITSLWANAATQTNSITALWANAATQTDSIDLLAGGLTAANVQIEAKASLASPEFTGSPTAPTQAMGNNSTLIATTEYVITQDALRKGYIDTILESNVTTLSDAITSGLAEKAPVNSPNFTGTPTTQTPSIGDNTTRLATTAYVMSQDAIRRVYVDTAVSGNITLLNNAVNSSLATKAPAADPTFTGTVIAPTPTSGDSSTKVATTEFVQTTIAATARWQGSSKYVSSGAPDAGLGSDGDFWFQYI